MNSVLEQLIPLADEHQRKDEYIKGHYAWQDPGACSIGCTSRDAIALGILPEGTDPQAHEDLAEATETDPRLWYLADLIFEGLPRNQVPGWTPRWMRAASKCSDTHKAILRWLAWLLGPDSPSAEANTHPSVAKEVVAVRKLCLRAASGDAPTGKAWSAAAAAAEAAWATRPATRAATCSAWAARAAAAAAAEEAAWAARALAEAEEAEAEAAEEAAYQSMAGRLIYELEWQEQDDD